MTKPLGATAIALFFFVLGASSASAAPITWTLQNVTFLDGGTGSGSFVYDATTNVYANINISVSATAGYPATTFQFLLPGGNFSFGLVATDSNNANLTGAHRISLVSFSNLTNAGGTIFISTNGSSRKATCANADCAQGLPDIAVTGGSMTTLNTPTPEPTTLSLIPLGLLVITAARWRLSKS